MNYPMASQTLNRPIDKNEIEAVKVAITQGRLQQGITRLVGYLSNGGSIADPNLLVSFAFASLESQESELATLLLNEAMAIDCQGTLDSIIDYSQNPPLYARRYSKVDPQTQSQVATRAVLLTTELLKTVGIFKSSLVYQVGDNSGLVSSSQLFAEQSLEIIKLQEKDCPP